MKSALVILYLATAVASKSEINNESLKNNTIEKENKIIDLNELINDAMNRMWLPVADEIIERTLKFTLFVSKIYFKFIEPVTYEISQNLGNRDINIKLVNITIDNISEYQGTILKSNVQDSQVDFAFYFPVINTTNTFFVFHDENSNFAYEKKGYFSVNITNLSVNGSMKYEFKNYLQVQNLNMSYNFTDAKVNVTKTPSSSVSKIKSKYINWIIRRNLMEHEKEISKYLSEQFVTEVNTKIKLLQMDIQKNLCMFLPSLCD